MTIGLWAVAGPSLHAGTGLRPYETNGTVIGVLPGEGFILIDHEPIEAPGYFMGKMEMPFSVADPTILNGLKAGDRVRFRVSEEKKSRIVELQKVTK
jgi:Cu/Ag efflux protein CusF